MSEVRILQFPQDRRVGDLMFVRDGEKVTAPARGAVEVPADSQPMLTSMAPQVRDGAEPAPGEDDGFVAGDLEPLAALQPDALHGLYAGDVKPGAAKDIAHLTGLGVAALMGELTDEDLAVVAALPAVNTISTSSTTATGVGLAALAERDEVGLVQVNLPAMTADGAVALAGIPASMLFLSGPAFTGDVLDAIPTLRAAEVSFAGSAIDRDALLRLLERSPDVKAIGARAGQEQVITGDTELDLRRARPDLTVNGTWLGAKAVAKLTAARAAG